MELAIHFSLPSDFDRPALTNEATPSCRREFIATGREESGARVRYFQTGYLSFVKALIRDALAGKWLRYPDRAGIAGAFTP